MGLAQFVLEPTALNSNLFPVKAKGDVRFWSVLSSRISGILPITFNFKSVFSCGDNFPSETCSRLLSTAVNCSPINTEIIGSGASSVPNRNSLLAETILARSSDSWFRTATIVLIKKVRNCRLFIGVFPGLNKLTPELVFKDQLLCFPEPLIPAKGFSCKRTMKLCFSAILLMTSRSNAL